MGELRVGRGIKKKKVSICASWSILLLVPVPTLLVDLAPNNRLVLSFVPATHPYGFHKKYAPRSITPSFHKSCVSKSFRESESIQEKTQEVGMFGGDGRSRRDQSIARALPVVLDTKREEML